MNCRIIAVARLLLSIAGMNEFTPIPALLGGAMIGLSASLLLLSHGKVAGISGIVGGLITPGTTDLGYRRWFVLGLALAGLLLAVVNPSALGKASAPSWAVTAAGLLVGYGTRLGNGCTSGHGVCGISRLSPRSLAATATFMASGALVVFLLRHVAG